MATKRTTSEVVILEQYRVSLENVENQSVIAAAMSELGFTTEVITEGKALLATTRQAFYSNKTEDDETNAAYAAFASKRTQLADTYSMHRKKAKVVFRSSPLICEKLGISQAMPKTYQRWLESVRKFYNTAITEADVQVMLARLRVTPEELTATQNLIGELEATRADYLREKGESQDATQIKDAAISQMDDWMSEFYAVARIALDDHPQLLEVLGKLVKN